MRSSVSAAMLPLIHDRPCTAGVFQMTLISRKEVLNRTSLSPATLWRKERAGEFPRAVRISTNRVAYSADAVEDWIAAILDQDHCNRPDPKDA